MKDAIKQDTAVHGSSEGINNLIEPILKDILPHLFGRLENSIMPCLLARRHVDCVAVDSGDPNVLDSSALWAHNECGYSSILPISTY